MVNGLFSHENAYGLLNKTKEGRNTLKNVHADLFERNIDEWKMLVSRQEKGLEMLKELDGMSTKPVKKVDYDWFKKPSEHAKSEDTTEEVSAHVEEEEVEYVKPVKKAKKSKEPVEKVDMIQEESVQEAASAGDANPAKRKRKRRGGGVAQPQSETTTAHVEEAANSRKKVNSLMNHQGLMSSGMMNREMEKLVKEKKEKKSKKH